MKSLHTRLAALFILLCISGGVKSTALFATTYDYVQPFSLSPVNEGIQLGLGAALSGSALACDKIFHIKENNYDAENLANPSGVSKADVAYFEQIFMNPYSKPLHLVGTGTMLMAMATPAVFAVMPQNEWLTIGTMYVETMLFAQGFKEWAKLMVYRARPYMYFEGYPQDKLEEGDWNCSFPSGHTTLSFAGAAFTTMVFCQCFPESKWKYAVAGGAFGIAAVTGALRMASGNHFLTDVLAGALLGSICGFAVPYMHTKLFYDKFQKKNSKVEANLTLTGLTFTVNF